jgi:dTDP-D-glucose 4,6-dehydratase
VIILIVFFFPSQGKRVAETMMYAYQKQSGVEVRVARIFNTFGPRMHPNDGRVVSNFIIQALQGQDLTIYGTGSQTRSFQYVDDLVSGLVTINLYMTKSNRKLFVTYLINFIDAHIFILWSDYANEWRIFQSCQRRKSR